MGRDLKGNEWIYKKTMYHRGKFNNSEGVYENTLEAYKLSMIDKAPFEFDVRLTKDEEIICLHDNDLKRLFNRERKVEDITYKRLNKLREDLHVPLLKDVLKEIDGKVELMIELKNSSARFNKKLVNKVYELLKDYKGKYTIVSFNPFMLRRYRRLDKKVPIGRITSTNRKGNFVVYNFLFKKMGKPDYYSMDVYSYSKVTMLKLKAKGYKIVGWPLKETGNLMELSKYFDNYIIEGFSCQEINK